MYPITSLSSGLLALIYVFLSVYVVKLRYRHKISLGSKECVDLEMAMRAHGNFAEYVPLALILLICAEANHLSPLLISIVALTFILGRLLHAYAFLWSASHFKYRLRGMMLTFGAIALLALLNIGATSIYIIKPFI